MKLSNFIAVASDATYFVPLRKGGKEKINKNNYLLSSQITFKKTLFHHHYSFFDYVPYFIDSENCAGPKCFNDFSIQVVHIGEDTNILEKVYPLISCILGITFFHIYKYVPSF